MKTQICYGIFAPPILPSLTTPDKQLHVGPVFVHNIESCWERIGNMISFLEEQCPSLTFTLVLDNPRAFKNPKIFVSGKD